MADFDAVYEVLSFRHEAIDIGVSLRRGSDGPTTRFANRRKELSGLISSTASAEPSYEKGECIRRRDTLRCIDDLPDRFPTR